MWRDRRRSLTFVATGVALAALPACSLLLSVDKVQCASAADCAGRGFTAATCSDGACVAATDAATEPDAGSDPTWGCVGHVTWPPEDGTRSVALNERVLHLLNDSPIPGMTFHPCRGLDISCSSPLSEATSDANGAYSLKVPFGFRGFLEGVPPPDSGVMPLLLPLVPPPFADEVPGSTEPVHVPTVDELRGLLTVIKRDVNPETGHAFGLAVDCQGKPAPGVRLEVTPVGPESVPYYSDETRLPSVTLGETTARGELGVVNLPPGPTTFRYFLGSRLIGTTTAQIRKGAVTAIALPPTPSVQ